MNSLDIQRPSYTSHRAEETLDLIQYLRYAALPTSIIHGLCFYFLISSYLNFKTGILLFEILLLAVSVCLTIALMMWTTKYIQALESRNDLYQEEPPQKLTTVLFTVTMLVWAANLLNIVIIYVQKQNTFNQLLGAGVQNYEYIENDLDFTLLFTQISSIVSILYYSYASVTTYRGFTYVNRGMAAFLSVSNILFLISTIYLIYEALDLLNYKDNSKITEFANQWIFYAYLYLSPALVFISIISAFSNYKKSRNGFLTTAFVMIGILFFFIHITGYGFRYARLTRDGFASEEQCLKNMALLSKDFLKQNHCESKYVMQNNAYSTSCDSKYLAEVWDESSTSASNKEESSQQQQRALSGNSQACLSASCCGIVGNLYSRDLYEVSYISSISLLTGSFVAVGSFFLWWVNWMDSNVKPKRSDVIWLVFWSLLFLFGVLSYVLRLFNTNIFYSIYPGTNYPQERDL